MSTPRIAPRFRGAAQMMSSSATVSSGFGGDASQIESATPHILSSALAPGEPGGNRATAGVAMQSRARAAKLRQEQARNTKDERPTLSSAKALVCALEMTLSSEENKANSPACQNYDQKMQAGLRLKSFSADGDQGLSNTFPLLTEGKRATIPSVTEVIA